MRSFTFVGGASSKFWQIGRTGATVTVRFGRIGTEGQTRTKEFGAERAATDHVEKLVAGKIAEGYVEDAAGPPAPSVLEPEVASGDGPEAARSGPAAPEPDDEDAWVVPLAWWKHVEPWRGVSPPRTTQVDRAAVQAYERLLARSKPLLRATLRDPGSDPELVEHAERSEPGPLGAAVVGAVIGMEAGWNDAAGVAGLVDAWVARHGLCFAAEAGARLAGIHAWIPGHNPAAWFANRSFGVRRAGPNTTRVMFDDHPLLSRLRAFLAAAEEATYAEVSARLEGVREEGPEVRVATSFLLPTRRDWAEADIRETTAQTPSSGARSFGWDAAPRLLASATTAEQVRALLTTAQPWHLDRAPGLLFSAAAYAGPPVAPLLEPLYEHGSADEQRRIAGMLAHFPTDEAFGLLLARLDQRYVQPAVFDAMNRFPRRAVRLLAAAASGTGARAVAARELLRGHLVSHPGLAGRIELTGAAAAALQKVAAGIVAVEPVPHEHIPPLLADPPWGARRKAGKAAVVEGLTVPAGARVVWRPGEREAWRDAGGFATDPTGYGGAYLVAYGAEHRARRGLTEAGRDAWSFTPGLLKAILARFSDDAVPYVLSAAHTRPAPLAQALLPIESPQLAGDMARWAAQKSTRAAASAWLLRHPEAAVRGLLPPALGKAGKERTYAEAALRFLAQNGRADAITAAAKAAGPAAQEAVDALLAVDPVDILPVRMPPLPAWLDPAHLPPVRLADGTGALPRDAVVNLCLMLALCRPGDTYAGLDAVRPALDAGDLAAFAWAVFERWRGADHPSRESWVLEAQGLLGDDETVRRLAPLIRTWPGEGASARAAAALDVLSAIGTDVALMHLHSISEKVSFKGLKAKAAEKIAEIAESLDLTPDQLADRLVPDLGLDERGGMVLDYGPRRFRVGFDEQLKPVVFDSDGSRRKLLPRPGAKDDPALAEAAYARFAGLKKDVKTIAADQIKRLERAMVAGRRWPAAEHRRLFVEHPLLTHLAARIVWLTVDQDGAPTGSFRVAEDRTYADETDSGLDVPADATVGVAHPLHLGADSVRAWAEVFADYEILQPFAQLGRDTYALTGAELAQAELERFHGAVVPTGRVLGLVHRGWERGSPEDSGVHAETYRHLGGDRYVVADLDPGIVAGAAMEEKVQTLTRVWLSRGVPDRGKSQGTCAFGELDAVTASEVLRDLEMLRA